MTGNILIHNAKIWANKSERFSWMVFDPNSGIIQDIENGDPPLETIPVSQRRDCGGKRVLPGFHESHIHVLMHGEALRSLNVEGTSSIEDFQARLKKYAEENKNSEWITGQGWEQDVMGRYPTRQDLDAVCPDRPVMILRVCYHVAVLNSKALQLMNISKDTPQPEDGVIDIYPEGHALAGEPTGILREKPMFNVMDAIKPDMEERMKSVQVGLRDCLEAGVTSVHSNEEGAWKEYCTLADKQQLPIRVFFCTYFSAKDSGSFPCAGETHGPMLSCDRAKIFSDGSLGASTAALSMPYVGTQSKGVLMHTQEEFNAIVKEATTMGFRLEIHVIGDAGADAAITALEVNHVAPERRTLLTHCQILRKDLVQRMKKVGAIANIQPEMVPTDAKWVEERVTPELLQYAYVWKTLKDNGITLAGGSDAPIEPPRPLLGIYDTMFRPHTTREPGHKVFKPEECLGLDDAIDMYTRAGAYATMKEAYLGQLLPGYQADFIVLDQDICEDPKSSLLTAKPVEVWVAGKEALCSQ